MGGGAMVRSRNRWLVLAVAAGALVVGPPVGAQERSPLENPDPVSNVRVKVDGRAALAAAESAGIDFTGNVARVPDGIEADALVTDEELLKLKLMGGEQVARGPAYAWASTNAQLSAAQTLARPPLPTVRIVRADYFSTKGQGFLYVEARTTDTTPDDRRSCLRRARQRRGHRVRLARHDGHRSSTPAST